MSRQDLFKEYRTTTKEGRVIVRREFNRLKKTYEFSGWVKIALKWQRGKCFYCDCNIRRNGYHVDHRIPIFAGGSNDYKNLVLSCRDCNMFKGTHQLLRSKKFLQGNSPTNSLRN